MGALADFIRQEFGDAPRAPKIESGDALAAIPAIPASPSRPNSGTSGNSSAPIAEFELPSRPDGAPDTRPEGPVIHRCETCGAIASFGYGWSFRDPDAGRWYCAAHAPKRGAA
jgi:hypothetical protein